MESKRLILASASPRRSGMLRQMGIIFDVIPSDEDEDMDADLKINELAMGLAAQKAIAVAKKEQGKYREIKENILEGYCLVIGADTIVCHDEIYGKPKNEEDAFRILKKLKDSWHEVITGVAVVEASSMKYETSYDITKVKMRDYSDDEIRAYIKTGHPMDKAGAYGISEIGALMVERIEGCYFNVIGLPLNKLNILLNKFGFKIL